MVIKTSRPIRIKDNIVFALVKDPYPYKSAHWELGIEKKALGNGESLYHFDGCRYIDTLSKKISKRLNIKDWKEIIKITSKFNNTNKLTKE